MKRGVAWDGVARKPSCGCVLWTLGMMISDKSELMEVMGCCFGPHMKIPCGFEPDHRVAKDTMKLRLLVMINLNISLY